MSIIRHVKTVVIITLLTTLIAGAGEAQARIYKTVDAEGNVEFTDVPPKDDAKAIEINTRNVYTPILPVPVPAAPEQPQGDSQTEPSATYNLLRIVSPTADEAIRENAGNINVAISSSPSLDTSRGHNLQLLVDGNILGSGDATQIALSNVDRGTHELIAQIVDESGVVLIASSPIEFHMLRYARPPQPKTAPPPPPRPGS